MYSGFRFVERDKADPTGFTDYLKTEYREMKADNRDKSCVPLNGLFSGYLTWAEHQGIVDMMTFNDVVETLVTEHYCFSQENGNIVISGIQKMIADKDIDCKSNQVEMYDAGKGT